MEGPVGDLAEALGLVSDGELQDDFFGDPGATLKGMLLDAERREKLLAVVEAIVAEAGIDLGPAETVDGRDWLPVVGTPIGEGAAAAANHVDVSVVLDHAQAGRTVVGLGVRYSHDPPAAGARFSARALVPLVTVPAGATDPSLAPGTAEGDIRIDVRLEPRIEGGPVDLESLVAVVAVPTDGVRLPSARVAAQGVRIGDADPVDVALDTASPITDQALQVGATLLRAVADAADPRLTALLRLAGLIPEPQIPRLPLEDLADRGRAAIWDWLRGLATPAAARAWVEALADLISENATVSGTGSPEDPARLTLALGVARLEITLGVRQDADGTPVVVPRVAVAVETPAAPPRPRFVARAEVDVLALRLAATPTAIAVPALRLFAHAGPDAPRGTAAALVDQPTPRVIVGSVEAGLAMDAERRVVPLLSAYEVQVGTGDRRVERPKVDLTDADAVADLGADTLDALVEEALAALGVGDEVRAALALLGLRDPHDFGGAGQPAWPHRTDLGALLADPLGALAGFLRAAIADGRAPVLLSELARLLPAGAGATPAVGGSGTAADPWTLALDDDPAADVLLTCRRSPDGLTPLRLHLGLRAAPAALDLGAVGRLQLAVDAELAQLVLPATGPPSAELAADVAVRATLRGVSPAAPLRLGDASLALEADALLGGLRWTPAGGLRVTGDVAGLRLEVDGEDVALALPSLDPVSGALLPPDPLPWDALEVLAAHALRGADAAWVQTVVDILGWGDAERGGHLSLEALVADPVDAVLDHLRGTVLAAAEREALERLMTWLAGVVGDVGPDADPADAALRGTGTPAEPWALRLRADRSAPAEPGGTGRSGELLLWCEPDGPALDLDSRLAGIALPSWLTLGTQPGQPPPTADELAAALADAAVLLPEAGHLALGRSGLAAAFAALRDRLAGGDGVLPAIAAVTPPGWTGRVMAGVGHGDLQAEWADGGLVPATTVFVSGPLGDHERWPLHQPGRVIDLRAPGLPAEAFDLAAVAAGPGPWFVVLPPRAAAKVDPASPGDGLDDLAARLRRVVAATHARAGAPVTVVAHSTAGLPARLVAAGAASGVGHLVTLGTPLAGAQLTFTDVRPAADAVHALRALWHATGLAGAPVIPELAPAAGFVEALTALSALDPAVIADLAAPATWPDEAPGITRETVTGTLDAAGVQRTIALAMRGGLQAALARVGVLPPVVLPTGDAPAPAPARRPVQALATGIRHDLASAPDARGIVVTTRVTITGPRLAADRGGDDATAPAPASAATDTLAGADGAGTAGTGADARAEAPAPALRAPGAEVRIRIHREDGWLVGGPLPAGSLPGPRGPRVRWAELVLGAELRGGAAASAAIVLHEAAAFGIERPAWTLRLGDGATLPAEARALLFRLASALGTTTDGGALPAAGASRALVDLLAALGLATLDGAGQVGLVGEAVERLLVAPGTALRDAAARGPDARRAIARALRALAGVPLPADSAPTTTGTPPPARVDVIVDGVRLVLDLDPMTAGGPPRLTVDATLALAGVLALSGGATVDLAPAGPVVAAHAEFGLDLDPTDPAPSGLLSLAFALSAAGAASLELRVDVPEGTGAAGWLPRRLALYPVADPAADLIPLLQLALALAPAELARMGAERAREALADAPAAVLLDAVLAALGLLGTTADPAAPRPVRIPMALVLDPGGWLRRTFGLDATGGAAGTAVAAAVDAVRGLTGLGDATTPSGRLPLPYGLELAVAGDAAAGGLTLSLATTAPVAASGAVIDLAAGVRITRDPALGVRAQGRLEVGVGLRPAGEPAPVARLRLVADDAVSLSLVLPGPPERIYPLVPAGPGLGDLVGDAAVRLLPVVLDAVVDHAGVAGDVVGDLGDALGIRHTVGTQERFDAAALSALAADPATALLARVTSPASVGEVLTALADLVETALGPRPAGFLTVTPGADHVTVVVAGTVSLTLRSTTAGLRFDVAADATVRVDGTDYGTVEAAVGVDQRGLAAASLGVAIDDDLLVVLGVPLLPWVRASVAPAERTTAGAETPASRPTLRAGLQVPSGTAGADAVVVAATVAAGQPLTVAVVDAAGVPVTGDVGLAVARVLAPLLTAIATEALQGALATTAGAGPDTVGDVLDGVLVRRVDTRWAPLPALLDPDTLLDRTVRLAQQILEAYVPAVTIDPLEVRATAAVAGDAVTARLRVTVGAGETWWLVDAGDLRIGLEVATDWLAIPEAEGGLEVALTIDPTDPVPVRDVIVAARGITVRVAGRSGGDLIDLGVRIRSIALSAAYAPAAPSLFGGRLQLDRIAVPLGGGGGNAVASKMLDADSTGGGTGDTERPQLPFSPELSLVSRAGGPVQVDVRAGEGDGPWWLPLQAQLGPVYVEQVGFGVLHGGGTITRLRLLVDGGVSLAGLTVQVDDLELRLPWPEAWDVSRWELDLAGLAVGYEASGITLAGALLREPPERAGDPPSYLGMVTVNASGFGISAFGGFGVYPVPGTATDTYVSFFVIAALHAPLGGPPAFFLTGLGGGIGINRQLILPARVVDLPQFPLVQALNPSSDIASDPMGALRRMGQVFPPQRGAIWFAAGVSFTSFSVVEGVAVLSVSIADGDVEIALMGLARLGLPNPRLPIAQIELALLARFSTRDMVLWIEAQLTDNSWVISHDARLTGGFAFVTWFRTGDFVVTLGGYHPDFHVEHYPEIPRVGLSWTLGEFLSIRGETYFALCSSAIMVGSRLDASLQAGPAYARVVAGFDALVKFDPLWFVVDIYASITGGIRIRIDLGWFGTITVDLTITIGARLHVEGPEVRGTAMLELGPIEVPFSFGPSGALDQAPLSWTAFRDKYLLPGGGQVLSVSVSAGQVAAAGAPEESRNDGRDPAKPWLVLPEFALHGATTLAAETYAGVAVPDVGGLGIGPMQIGDLSSDWRITVAGTAGDRTARLAATPATTGLPVAIWRALPANQSPAIPAGVELVTGCTAVDVEARATVPADDGPASFDPYDVEEDRDLRKPLPFPTERDARPGVRGPAGDAVRIDVATVAQAEVMTTLVGWLEEERIAQVAPVVLVPHGRGDEAEDPVRAERVRLLRRRARGWQAVPRPVRITEGLGPDAESPVRVEPVAALPPKPGLDRSAGRPDVVAVLHTGVAPARGRLRTTVMTLAEGGDAAAQRLPRRAAPAGDPARAVADPTVAARLVRAAPALARADKTVVPTDGGVATAQAGAFAELRGGLAAPKAEGAALAAAATALLDGGAALVAGQVLVLAMPNPHDDADPERPAVAVAGEAAVRVVSLDAAGRPLADVVVRKGRAEVPRRTARIALVGAGVDAGAVAGLPGWHAAARVAEVVPGTAVTPGAVVRGPAGARRGGRPPEAALPSAAQIVHGVGLVETTLPATTRTLVVALDRGIGGDDELDGLVVGLDGLRRRTGPDGELAPRVVASGARTVLLYPVEPVDGGEGRAGTATATASVASDERWELAGVLGATLPADRLARDVLAGGIESLLAPFTPSPLGSATVTWIEGGGR